MLCSFVLPLFAVFCIFSLVAGQTADSICSASNYTPFACLTGHNVAASLCSKLPRQTATLTVTTTTLDVNSILVTAHATSQTTVRVTSTQMSTVTIVKGPVQTITTQKINLVTENATITTYVPTAKVALVEPSCVPDVAASSLGSLLPGFLATACSCIGHPGRTTTVTSTVTAPAVKTRTTEFVGTAPTTTIYEVALSTTTITEHPTKYVTQTTESCTTSTITVSYAAPTFTHAFGPKAGCIDTAASSSKILPQTVKDLHSAVQQCKSLCSQDSTCSAVYVQHMTMKRAGLPHYHCFFNDKKLNMDTDLSCFPKPKKSIYGVAIGYDACDRGTEAL